MYVLADRLSDALTRDQLRDIEGRLMQVLVAIEPCDRDMEHGIDEQYQCSSTMCIEDTQPRSG